MRKPVLACVAGTRPEAIKVAPVVQELRKYGDRAETLLISTGQHREMLEQSLSAFGITPDIDLKIMQHGATLAAITARALEGLDSLLAEREIDIVLAQGDTTTTFCAALAAFYRNVPFAHIEAGLRTESIKTPFPEEFNRRAAGLITELHFPPTHWAAMNLIREGKSPEKVFVTGNTGIDAVLEMARKNPIPWFPEHKGRIILLTTHRRENWGEPQAEIAAAARQLLDENEDVILVVPMHRNPTVREVLTRVLGDHPRVKLIEPPDYLDFVPLMKRADLILTDSGGVQEEAPAFGKPVLVLRDTTERPEGVQAGVARLVGANREVIIKEGRKLLGDPAAYSEMSQRLSPYGDGQASQRIRYQVFKFLGITTPEVMQWA